MNGEEWSQTNTKTQTERAMRCVSVTPISSENPHDATLDDALLWWQYYEDDFGWKNVNPEANRELIRVWRAGQAQEVRILHKWTNPRTWKEQQTNYMYDLENMEAKNEDSDTTRPARIVTIEEVV